MEFNYDGSSIHPYEVMFVPMNTIAIENGWSYAKLAALYETWIRLQVFLVPSLTKSILILVPISDLSQTSWFLHICGLDSAHRLNIYIYTMK